MLNAVTKMLFSLLLFFASISSVVLAGVLPTQVRNSTAVENSVSFISNTDLPPFYNPYYNPNLHHGSNSTSTIESRSLPPFDQYGGRRGLAFNNGDLIQQFCGSQVSWAYNWDSRMPDNFPTCLKYVPMLWGQDAYHLDNVCTPSRLVVS